MRASALRRLSSSLLLVAASVHIASAQPVPPPPSTDPPGAPAAATPPASSGQPAPPVPTTAVAPAPAPSPPGPPAAPELPPRDVNHTVAWTPSAGQGTPASSAQLRDLLSIGNHLTLSGYFWVDTGYMSRLNGQPGQYDQSVPYMNGRFVLGASYWQTIGNYFGLAKVEFLGLVNEYAKNQYEPHTLDAYVMIGHKKWWDIQVGRFLAWEVYHRGQGIELFTAEEAGALNAPGLYWLDLTRGYRNESGQAAFHLYPHKYVKFEVAGVYGQESNQNNFGVRPVMDLRVGGFNFAAGAEYLQQSPQTSADKVQSTSMGFAGRLQYQVSVITIGANYAFGHFDALDIQGLADTAKSFEKMSFGGYVDIDFWRNSIGLGYHRTQMANKRNEHNTHDQAFVSYLVHLPIKGLAVKLVYGFARGYVEDSTTTPLSSFENLMHSVRLRISYEFH